MWTWECGSIRTRADTATDWCRPTNHAIPKSKNPLLKKLHIQSTIILKLPDLCKYATKSKILKTISYSPDIPLFMWCTLILFIWFIWRTTGKKNKRCPDDLISFVILKNYTDMYDALCNAESASRQKNSKRDMPHDAWWIVLTMQIVKEALAQCALSFVFVFVFELVFYFWQCRMS